MKTLNKKFLFIIGGQRSGTSFLQSLLMQHPSILFAKPISPEPKYFIVNKNATIEDFLYKYNLNSSASVKVFAEKSTSYHENRDALNTISRLKARKFVLLVVRNPVERAISNYFFSRNNGIESRTLEEVFLKNLPAPVLENKISVDPFNYIERGFYSKYIKTLRKIFNAEELILIPFNELVKHPIRILNQIYGQVQIPIINEIEINKTRKNDSPKRQIVTDKVYKKLEDIYEHEIDFLYQNNLI